MSESTKYPRTFHYPFSPGTTSDDRISRNYWECASKIQKMIHLEKIDGENTCLKKIGVFSRSHAAPTLNPWAGYLKERWESIKHDLGDLEIFGENLYAIHSIKYVNLESHFFVFGVKDNDRWLSWEEVKFYAGMLDFPVVPEIEVVEPTDEKVFRENILEIVKRPSFFGSTDLENNPCTMEGVVSRNIHSFHTNDFQNNVFKWVRKGHVKTDEHWSKNWKRAPLKHETHERQTGH